MQDIKAGSMVQGGSTITQQLAKMLFLKPEKSFVRKLKEAVISIKIERRYTKDEILGLYLNQTYFGHTGLRYRSCGPDLFRKNTPINSRSLRPPFLQPCLRRLRCILRLKILRRPKSGGQQC